jgi:hypothetical protein
MNRPNPKLLFAHIPKTGGVSIHLTIKEAPDYFYNHQLGYFGNQRLPKYVHHCPAAWLEDEQYRWYKTYARFTVVRNPYDRLLSRYFMQTRATYGNISAADMNRYLQEHLHDGEHEDGAFIPQYDFCYRNDELVVDHILRFERLKEDFDHLMCYYKVRREDHSFLSLERHSNNGRQDSTLSVSDMTRETLDLINRLYHNDFEYFSYVKV